MDKKSNLSGLWQTPVALVPSLSIRFPQNSYLATVEKNYSLMNRKLILLGLLLAAAFTTILSAQNTPTPNYELAARFSPDHIKKMVFSTKVSPHWLKNSDRFWYTYETSQGKRWYLVNPSRRTKTDLFDVVKIAADMSRLTGDPFDAQHLNIQKLKFIKNETALQWEVTSKLVEVEEEDEDQEEDDMEQEKDSQDKKKKKKMVPKVWHFEYDLRSQELTLIEDFKKKKEDAKWASIAPDSSYVLFSRNHNLYWMDWNNYLKAQKNEKDSTIVDHQWTTDGEAHDAFGSCSSELIIRMKFPAEGTLLPY